MDWLIGHTGKSFFDAWTTVHFSFWYFVGSVLWSFGFDRFKSIVLCALVAYVWKILENLDDKGWPHFWANYESWYNAYVSDIAVVFVSVYSVWWILDNWRLS